MEIKAISEENIKMFRDLYEEAFPPQERIGFEDLLRLAEQMPLTVSMYYESGKFIGFTVFHERSDFNWFWYFAVSKELRGNGYGQRILTEMLRRYNAVPMIIDAESPFQEDCDNVEQRMRRYRFYLRNGFVDTKVGRTFEGITYSILLHGKGIFTMADYDRILSDLRHHWSTMPHPDNNE